LAGAAVDVPWEAMAVGSASLAERLHLGRQLVLDGATAPSRARASALTGAKPRVLVVADPAGDLPHAAREGELLAGLLGAADSGCQVTLRAGRLRRDELLAALRTCDAIHFAGHSDPPDAGAGWRLADGWLAAGDVAAMAGGAACPSLVFAHACRSAAGHDDVLTAFVRAGARHAVGTQWDVPDEAAPEAASCFWRAVLSGGSCGAALLEARAAAGPIGGAAYLLLGDPGSRSLDGLGACGACHAPSAAPGSLFCDRCGAPLGGAGRSGDERRRVTVVCVGVEPHPEADPEDVHRHLNECYAHVSAVVRRFGGTVDRFAGDAVVAVFGAPAAHENDPERAVLTAVEVVKGPGAGVAARAGVQTGVAVVGGLGDDRRRDHGLAGAVLIEANKLMRAALPGQVICGAETARRVETVVRCAPVSVTGLDGARRVVGPRATGRRRAGPFGRPLPLVGRREELARLHSIFASVRRDRVPASVTIGGGAGIGKSRLADAFLADVRSSPAPPRVATGAALPYEGADPYGPVAELLRELLSIREGATDADLVDALDDALTAAAGPTPQDTLPEWVPLPGGSLTTVVEDRRALTQVLGLESPDASEDASARRHRVHAAVQRFLEQLARSGPIVLCLVDVHWASDATLDLWEDLGRFLEGVPVLLVTLARPGLRERRPHFGEARPDHVQLDLGPLDEEACEALIRSIATRAGPVDDEAARSAVRRSDGNPLFLEELIKDYLERGEEADGEGVPETLGGVLAARLDRCDDEERAILRRAAVAGRSFWLATLEAMGAPGNVAKALQALRARGLLLRREPSHITGHKEFVFKHSLMRDVAYERTPRGERRALHRAAAAWLEGLPGVEEHLDARAEHYERAGDALQASILRATAGDRAAAVRSDREAQVHYRTALDLLGQVDPVPGDAAARRLDLRGRLADSLARTGEFDDALEHYRGVQSDPALGPERRAELLRREARVLDSRGDFDGALAALEGAAGQPEGGTRDPALQARLLADRGWVFYRLANLDDAEEAYRRALELLGDDGPATDRAQVHSLLGALYYSRSDLARAVEHHEEALQLRERLGDSAGIGKSYNNLGIVAERRGDLDAAADWHARSVRLKAAAGDRPGLALAYNNLGVLYWKQRDLERAAAAFTASLDLKRRLGNRWGEAITLANLAEVLLDKGDLDGCTARLAEAEARSREAGNPTLIPEVRRLEAQAAQSRGDVEQARELALAAVDAARELGDAVREGAALRVLGEATQDRTALQDAVRVLESAGDQAEARRAQQALDALPPTGK